jgi:hypothetical protein
MRRKGGGIRVWTRIGLMLGRKTKCVARRHFSVR